ncbi:MAG: LuxR C-terminal-related transcriptional regulator [Bacillota bacterium]|nr:LuxR C-terminal-related transcriptional regulator [Bacillota bacterium]
MSQYPHLDDIYISGRLRQRLERIAGFPVTTVIAPTGYGKTTALRWWKKKCVKQTPDAVVISQTISADSTTDYWSGLCRALRDYPVLAGQLTALGFPKSREDVALLSELLTAALSETTAPVFYILDDIHCITDSWFSQFLFQLTQSLPEPLHMILLSRSRIFDEADLFRLGGATLQITADDLRLTQDEICGYAANCGLSLEKTQAGQLARVSEGWIALIYLMFCSFLQRREWRFETLDILELMEQVVFSPQPERRRRFLSVNSLPDGFTLEQAAALWQEADCAGLLDALSHENAFISRSDNGVYRYHYMLRQVAIRSFKRLPEAEQAQYQARLARWHMGQKEYVQAALCFEECGDWDGILEALALDQSTSFDAERFGLVVGWAAACPEEILLRHPAALVAFMLVFFYTRDIPQMLRFKTLFERSMEQNTTLTRTEREQLEGEVQLRLSFLAFNSISGMSVYHRKIRALMPYTRNPWCQGSPSVIMLYHSECGRLDAENAEMGECMPIYHAVSNEHGSGAASIMQGETDLMRGRLTDAEIQYHTARQTVERTKEYSTMIASEFLAARLAIFKGDPDAPYTHLARLRDTLMGHRQYRQIPTVELAQAWISALLRQTGEIPPWIRSGDARRIYPLVAPIYQIIVGQVLLAKEEWSAVVARKGELAPACERARFLLCTIYLRIQTAAALDQLGRRAAAMKELTAALDLAMPDGLLLPFAENGDFVSIQLRELQKKGVWPDRIDEILALIGLYRSGKKEILRKRFGTNETYGLTGRELEVARLAAQRGTVKEIASALHLSENTVKTHLRHVYEKMNISGTNQNKRSALRKALTEN